MVCSKLESTLNRFLVLLFKAVVPIVQIFQKIVRTFLKFFYFSELCIIADGKGSAYEMKTVLFLLLACFFLFSLNAIATFYVRKDKYITTETLLLYQHLKTLTKKTRLYFLPAWTCTWIYLVLSATYHDF